MAELGMESASVFPSPYGISDRVLQFAGFRKRLLILGDGKLATDLARVLVADRQHRFELIGFLSHELTIVVATAREEGDLLVSDFHVGIIGGDGLGIGEEPGEDGHIGVGGNGR